MTSPIRMNLNPLGAKLARFTPSNRFRRVFGHSWTAAIGLAASARPLSPVKPRSISSTSTPSLLETASKMASAAQKNEWSPPKKIEDLYSAVAGGNFSAINQPNAGPREQKELPRGDAAFQLYSLSTPNGQKAGIMLEELAELGLIEYDAHGALKSACLCLVNTSDVFFQASTSAKASNSLQVSSQSTRTARSPLPSTTLPSLAGNPFACSRARRLFCTWRKSTASSCRAIRI
jgi:hypothetical protein